MQFLRVAASQLHDKRGRLQDVDPYEAGLIRITDSGERLLSIYSLPDIIYRILDDDEPLTVIR